MNTQYQADASRPSRRRIELMLEDDYMDGVGGWPPPRRGKGGEGGVGGCRPPPTPPAEKAASRRLAAPRTKMLSFRF
jgi:hypothetical protein